MPLWQELVGLVSFIVVAASCEPSTITEARDQLRRGGPRIVEFVVPVIDTSFSVDKLLDSSLVDTTAAGLLAVKIDPESLTVDVGEKLDFQNIVFDSFVINLTAGQVGVPPNTQIPINGTYSALASDTILDTVDTVLVNTGTMSVTTKNRLPVSLSYTLTLAGFIDAGGNPLSASSVVPAAPGDGTFTTDVLNFNLAGVSIVPADVRATIAGTATVGGTPINIALGDSALVQTGSIPMIKVEALSGPLDPTQTPELIVSVEQSSEVPRSNVQGFSDLEDAIKGSTLNDATILLNIDNSSGAPAVLSAFNVGVVKLDLLGNLPRDGSGNLIFETDSAGNPILVPVTDVGQATLTLARSSSSTITLAGAALVDRLVDLVLNDDRASIVAAGSIEIGDGGQSRISRTDTVKVRFDLTVGLDITIPDSGVVFTRNTVEDGLDFQQDDADELTDRLVSTVSTNEAVNQTPFGALIEIAFVSGDVGNRDVFAEPGAVILSPLTLAPPTVDAQGMIVQPSTSTLQIQLTAAEVRQLLDLKFTAGVRVRLMPAPGGSGRGAVRASDEIKIGSKVSIRLQSGS
ncbi:MAG: hypothetical protein ACE5HT_12870 [Gemmatimonadales bacterium]